MTHQDRARRGPRVVALGGEHLASVRDWIVEVDRAAPRGDPRRVEALLMDFRAQSYALSAEEAGTLLEDLRARFGRHMPPLATVARAGGQFGGTRVLCTVAELSGYRAAAFLTKAEAWAWLRGQLDGRARLAPPA